MKLQKWSRNFLIASCGLLILSCAGQTSNPLEKYEELKAVPETNQTSETQKIAPQVFELALEGTNEVNAGNLVEGLDGRVLIKVIVKSLRVSKYRLDISSFPVAGMPELRPSQQPHVFELLWKPPMGLIPAGTTQLSLNMKLQATVVESSESNLVGIMEEKTIQLFISRSNQQPRLVGHSKLDMGVDEGQTIPFTVDLDDPATPLSPRLPEILITSYKNANTEAYRADGMKYFTMDPSRADNPQKISATTWRFYYRLSLYDLDPKLNRLGIADPLAPQVDVCFHLRGQSVIGTFSSTQQVCFVGRYAAQLPVLKWEDESLKEVIGGATTTLRFEIYSVNGLGSVQIKNALTQLNSLPGKKEIKCASETPEQQFKQKCEITWTPTCVKAAQERKITLQVDHVSGKKSKSQKFQRVFSIVPGGPEVCPVRPTAPSPRRNAAPSASSTAPAASNGGQP